VRRSSDAGGHASLSAVGIIQPAALPSSRFLPAAAAAAAVIAFVIGARSALLISHLQPSLNYRQRHTCRGYGRRDPAARADILH